MTLIDIHAHLFPGSVLRQLRDQGSRLGVSYDSESRVLGFPSGASRPVFEALVSVDGREAWNLERGITHQVLSPWMDVAGDDLKGDQAAGWASLLNDGVASEIAGRSMFLAFATLPISDGEASARELRRCADELGFVGGALPTQVGGMNLSEAGLEPLFEVAEGMELPLFLHPFRVLGATRLQKDFMTNICGNPFETTVAALDLFFGGVFDRFPRLKVLLSHCGGTLPMVAGRAAHGSRSNPAVRKKVGSPDEILQSFYYDSLLHDVRALTYGISRVAADRVALGTDVPFPMSVDDPVAHILAALGPNQQSAFQRIAEGTARELLGNRLASSDELH